MVVTLKNGSAPSLSSLAWRVQRTGQKCHQHHTHQHDCDCMCADPPLQQAEAPAEPMEVEPAAAQPASIRTDEPPAESAPAPAAADSAQAVPVLTAAGDHTQGQAVPPLVQYSGDSVSQLSGECTAEGVLQQEVAQALAAPHFAAPAAALPEQHAQQQDPALPSESQMQVCMSPRRQKDRRRSSCDW